MMGCDGACAAGFDLVFIGLPLLSLYEIPMLIWFIWRAFHWKRDDKDWLKARRFLQLRWSLRCSFGCRPGMRGLVDTGDRILVKDN